MIDWPRALAWRMRQQLLEPVGTESVAGVVRRLGAVPAQSDASAELAIRTRRAESKAGEVTDALAAGRIIRTFAFRGATHLLTPEEGAAYLALRASSRMWELPSWQSFYQLSPSDWPPFRAAVRDALVDGPRTREELGAIVVSRPEFRHLQSAFSDRALTLLKPLAWQGDISFGPPRDGRATFQRLDRNAHWAGLPDIDEAGLQAVEAYLRTYGPATPDHLRYWLGEGLGVARKRIQSWIAGLADRVAAIDIEGDSAYVLRDDLADLEGTPPSSGGATAAGTRPMGARSWHGRPPRRPAGEAEGRHPWVESGDRRRCRVRDMVDRPGSRDRRLVLGDGHRAESSADRTGRPTRHIAGAAARIDDPGRMNSRTAPVRA